MKIISALVMLLICAAVSAKEVTLASPDSNLVFSFQHNNGLSYSIKYKGKTIIEKSKLGVAIENKLLESALGIPNEAPELRGAGWCNNLQWIATDHVTVDTLWTPVYGEWKTIRDNYNEITLRFKKGDKEEKANTTASGTSYVKSKCYFMNVKVRAYNEGIAFCYEFPETTNGLFLHLTDELTEFRLDTKAKVWTSEWAQGRFISPDIAKPFDGEVERPMTVKLPDGTAMALLEARLEDYVRTKFKIVGNGVIKAQPHSSCDVMTPFATSWRLVMVADKMTDLCNHDYMVLNLNKPCEGDFSWIKPGKVFRSDLKKEAIFKSIDFAASQHLQYVHLDAGWYGPEMLMASSAMNVADNRDFSIPVVVEYAKSKGIGVFLYINQRALFKELEPLCKRLTEWGVKGVKFGFVQVGNQLWTSWLHEAVKTCQRYHLMVDIHDEYRPTGLSRTYPALMTAEGIAGNEEMPDATHNVTLPFTRFLCGPADYTLCYYNGRVKNTHAHQLAMAVVYYSPLTWMYWYDKPQMYRGEPELEFWSQVPTVWDDTKVLQGDPDKFIVTARRSGDNWFVGAMNGCDSVGTDGKRMVDVSLDFLEKGGKYVAHVYEDDPTISEDVDNKKMKAAKRTKVKCTVKTVTAKSVLHLPLLPKGGAAVWIEKKTK